MVQATGPLGTAPAGWQQERRRTPRGRCPALPDASAAGFTSNTVEPSGSIPIPLRAEPFLARLWDRPYRRAELTTHVQHAGRAKQNAEVVLPACGTRHQHHAVLPTVGRSLWLFWSCGEQGVVKGTDAVDVSPETFAVLILALAVVWPEVQAPMCLEQLLLFGQQGASLPFQLSVSHRPSLRPAEAAP